MKMLFIPKISYFWSGQSKSVSQNWSRNQSYDVRKADVKMQQKSYRRKDVSESLQPKLSLIEIKPKIS